MSKRADLDWTAVGQSSDPVKGDVSAIDGVVKTLASYSRTLNDVASAAAKATGSHASFIGSAAHSLDVYLSNTKFGAAHMAELCTTVHDALNTWAAWVEGYQSEADPKCREAMRLRKQLEQAQKNLKTAKDDLIEQRYDLERSQQRQNSLAAAQMDADPVLDAKVDRLTQSVGDSQSKCEKLNGRIADLNDRLKELRRDVASIAQDYEDDAKRIQSTIQNACVTVNTKFGQFLGNMGNLQTFLGVPAVVGTATKEGNRVFALRVGLKINQKNQEILGGINDSLSGDSITELYAPGLAKRAGDTSADVTNKFVERLGVTTPIPGEMARGFAESGTKAIGGSVVGGLFDGVGTYAERIDTQGREQAQKDALWHAGISTATGAFGSAVGGAIGGAAAGALAGSAVPGLGTAVGAVSGTVAGFVLGWVGSAAGDAAYDQSQYRGDGRDFSDRFKENLSFWDVD